MAGFSRINPDVIDLGTTQISGATSRLFASPRDPWDGSIAGATVWNPSTSYFIGNVVIHQGYHYVALTNHTGTDPFIDTSSRTSEYGTDWKAIDGKDGDIWIKVASGSSAVLQKTNNTWNLLGSNFSGAGIPLNDNAVGDLAFSYDASLYRTAVIEYYIISDSGNNFERGQMNVVNNGTHVYGTEFNINSVGNDQNVDFLFQLNISGEVEVRYNSGALPNSRVLYIILRS